MKKLVALLATVVVGITVGAGAASATGTTTTLPYPPPTEPTLTISSSTVAPGGSVLAEFGGCTVGGTVTFTLNGSTVEVTSVETATGSVASTTLTAPTTPGAYPIVATCVPTGESATVVLTVAAAAGGGGGLPATGSDSAPTVQIATGIVAVGVGLATVGGLRRRKRAAAA